VRREIFVVEGPTPFQVDDPLPGAVAAGEGPGVACIDAGRCRVQIVLIGVARVVGGIDQWIGAYHLNLDRAHRRPLPQLLGHRLQVPGLGHVDVEELVERLRAIARVPARGLLLQFSQPLRIERGENRPEGNGAVLINQPPPAGRVGLLEHDGRVVRHLDVGVVADDHPRRVEFVHDHRIFLFVRLVN
jgi:hypothetical protein